MTFRICCLMVWIVLVMVGCVGDPGWFHLKLSEEHGDWRTTQQHGFWRHFDEYDIYVEMAVSHFVRLEVDILLHNIGCDSIVLPTDDMVVFSGMGEPLYRREIAYKPSEPDKRGRKTFRTDINAVIIRGDTARFYLEYGFPHAVSRVSHLRESPHFPLTMTLGSLQCYPGGTEIPIGTYEFEPYYEVYPQRE